ncbi:MAG: NAD+ synthase [Candidatus Bathyarchaeota archaeon]|nr:NAD+ synthase [Candidatus Bathyarchaeota archaeon]
MYAVLIGLVLKYLERALNREATSMELTDAVLDMNWAEVAEKIKVFIKDYAEKAGAKGLVVSLSGGVDSCTVAALSSLAIGGKNVLGLMLPEKETWSETDIEHSKLVAKKFSLETQQCDITSTLKALYRSIPVFDPSEKVCKGNLKARTRMIYVYYYANKLGRIVCGSSDKSETMLGYFTKWGDIAADISPIMDLYKTQVRKLARYIGIPEPIVTKPSSPALWPGQTAENELGLKYEHLDLVLYGLEHFMNTDDIAEQVSVHKTVVEKIRKRWLSAEHKRRVLLTTKLEYRTVGMDFRLPRSR